MLDPDQTVQSGEEKRLVLLIQQHIVYLKYQLNLSRFLPYPWALREGW